MVSILDVPFSEKTMKETVAYLSNHIDTEEKPLHVVTANPEIVMASQRNREFLRILQNEVELITPDGIGIVIASKLLNMPLSERVAGYDLLHQILSYRHDTLIPTKIFLFGAKDWVVQEATKKIVELYPTVEIVGFHHGFVPLNSDLEKEIVSNISVAKPDILLVGMGAPRQELFIHKYKHVLNTKLLIGVGGTFDVLSGNVKRAPKMFQKLYLEWLYRLLSQPSRMKRQLDIPRFLFRVIEQKRKEGSNAKKITY